MNDKITKMNLSFGTAAIFEDAELLPANGEFEYEGQRCRAKEILMTGAVRPIRKVSLS